MSNPFDIRPPYSPRLVEPPPPPLPPQPGGGKLLWGLLLAGGGVLVLFAIGAAAGTWLVLSGPHFTPEELWHEQLVYVIDTSVLPRRERAQVLGHVKRLARACEADVMSEEDLETVLTRLEAAPVFVLLDLGWIDQQIVHAAGLSAAEQRAAGRTLERVARGVGGGKIASGDFYAALPKGYAQPTRLTVALSDEALDAYYEELQAEAYQEASLDEIRAGHARLKALADQAGITDEPWEFDVSDEFGKAVDQALAGIGDP